MQSLTVEHLSKFYRLKRGKNAPPHDVYARQMAPADGPRGTPHGVWALRNVSFAVTPGTILGVIGPNGAGKTTLLKVIGRVTLPTEGRVVGRGRVVPLLEVGSGFHPDLSGRENVYLNAALHGIPRGDVARRFDDIVEFAGIGNFIDVPLKHYSSGMYLRLAFSVAVNMQPEILLADEVLAVGDLEFQERCLQRVQEVSAAGMTVLFVSHDMGAITRLCHKVLWLNAGRQVQIGEPARVVDEYQHAAWAVVGSRARQGRTGSQSNKHGEILSVRLVSEDGKELGAVRMSDAVGIKITFHILTLGVRVRCAVDVYTRNVHVFRSVQPEEFAIDVPAVYSATVKVPSHLLSDTIYAVTAGVAIADGNELYSLADYNALSFQVYETDMATSARGSYKGRLGGVVTPKLTWQFVKERDVIRA